MFQCKQIGVSMGRWRGNRRKWRKKNTVVNENAWNWQERQSLGKFFRNYKKGINQLLTNGRLLHFPSIVIGKVVFPELTPETLQQRYLELPVELTSKQRKMVHEVCTEADLFHAAVGEDDNRKLVVSYYADGFKDIQDLEQGFHFRFIDYKPHIFSSENTVKELIKPIEALIDQPGDCVREFDKLDYERLNEMDLSDIDPPTRDGTYILVDSAEKMITCAGTLLEAAPKEIGFDLEAFNLNKHAQLTCLVQLSSDQGHEYVIDTLSPGVWDQVPRLAPIFADPSIVKIGHSIGGLDVKCLHRDFGIVVVNAFDTYEAVKVLGLQEHGLAAVCRYYGLPTSDEYQELKDEYQAMDWRQRPLTGPMIQYGRYDVHYLIRLRQLIMRDLTRADLFDKKADEIYDEAVVASSELADMLQQIDEAEGELESNEPEQAGKLANDEFGTAHSQSEDDNDYYTSIDQKVSDDTMPSQEKENAGVALAKQLRMQQDFVKVLSISQERCKSIWRPKSESCTDDAGYRELQRRARRKEIEWTDAQDELYKNLCEWRDKLSADLQCLSQFVCDTSYLLMVAHRRPKSDTSLRRLLYRHPTMLEDNGAFRQKILDLVAASLVADGKETDEDTIFLFDEIQKSKARNRMYRNVALTLALGAAAVIAMTLTRKRKR